MPTRTELAIANMEENTTSYYPISLGHNCIPAYYLGVLGLREQSLPFDWLLSPSHLAIDYVVELINTDFKYFLADLQYDQQGKVFSGKYPEVKFWHHDLLKNGSGIGVDWESNESDQILAFERRVKRFIRLISSKNIFFINTFKVQQAGLKQEITFFWDSVARLIKLLERRKVMFQLLVILYDNEDFCLDAMIKAAYLHNNIHVRKFVRDTNINPYFGCEKAFRKILREFFILGDLKE